MPILPYVDLDALILASEEHAAKYANTLPQHIPVADRDAQRARDIAIANSSPEQLAVTLAENNDCIGFRRKVA